MLRQNDMPVNKQSMKKLIFIAVLPLFLAVLSCTRSAEPEGYGYVNINVSKDLSVDAVDITGGSVLTKADETSAPIALSIYDSEEEVVFSTDDCASLDGPVRLSTGSYRAVATSGTDPGAGAAFDTPFYSATADFTVGRNISATLDMVLTLDAVKVTAEFPEEIRQNFSSYVLTVSNGVSSLEFRSGEEDTTGRTGYFAVTGTLSYSLVLTGNNGFVYQPITGSYTDVKARQHYAFSFRVETREPEGGAEMVIVVDDSVKETVHDIVLDFTVQDIPEMTASFDLSSPLEFTAGDAASKTVTVDLKKDASSVEIRHNDAGLASAGLENYVQLVDAAAETVSALENIGIRTSAVTSGMLSVSIDFTSFLSSLPAGSYSFELFVQNVAGGEISQTVQMEVHPALETVEANAWARFAVLKGKWLTESQPEGLGFQWRNTSGEWQDAGAEVTVDSGNGTFTARLDGLDPETAYEFRAVTSTSEGDVLQFTTESEQTLHNMNFDSWYQNGDAWYPDASADYKVWDTANPGSASYGIVPTVPSTDVVAVQGEGKAAAKLESLFLEKYIITVNIFAAGNIYTGSFVKSIVNLSNPGAELDWGVPFTSRPLALKGYYHYLPKAIDKAKDPYTGLVGQMDTGQIQVILTDWDTPFHINTQQKQFVDVAGDSHIIAYGTMDLDQTDSYQEFTLRLDYRDMTRKPRYIVIVAAASKYGDYFTGGVGSTLYVDEFSFVYDPEELPAE